MKNGLGSHRNRARDCDFCLAISASARPLGTILINKSNHMTFKFDFNKLFGKIKDKISYKSVVEAQEKSPKRICFNSCHSDALKETGFEKGPRWALFIPFEESIRKIFIEETGLDIYPTKKGKYWCPITTEADYKKALDFKTKYLTRVFLRDNLDLSISLSENFDSNEDRTDIGELEFKAKYQKCEQSISELAEKVNDFIKNTPYYKDTNIICAIPSSKKDEINLPSKIANILEKKHGFENISNKLKWVNEKEPLKNTSLAEKWDQLTKSDIYVESDFKNENIILLDDLYQSGTTIQFVAMKLKEADISNIYGLTLVKSRRDTDNQ